MTERKKSFWKQQKEAIIAKKEKKNAGEDEPEILQIEAELQGVFNSSTNLIEEVNNFVKYSRNYLIAMSEAANSYLLAFPDGNELNEIAQNSATSINKCKERELNQFDKIINIEIISKLKYIKNCSEKLLQLGEERDKARILMKRSDVTLEEVKAKKDQKKISEKLQKNQTRHREFQTYHNLFLSQANDFLSSYLEIYDKAFNSFQFFIGVLSLHLKKEIFDTKGDFPYDELAQFLQPISIDVPDIPEEFNPK